MNQYIVKTDLNEHSLFNQKHYELNYAIYRGILYMQIWRAVNTYTLQWTI